MAFSAYWLVNVISVFILGLKFNVSSLGYKKYCGITENKICHDGNFTLATQQIVLTTSGSASVEEKGNMTIFWVPF